MRSLTRTSTAAAAVLAFAVLTAGGSASGRGDDVTLDGKLTVVHSDDFAHGRSDFSATLDTGQATYDVQLADDTDLPRASRVRVHGHQVNANTVAVGKNGLSAAPDSTVVAATTGAKKVLVVLTYFGDQSVPSSPTQASVTGVVFTNSNSVANYYSTVSWGLLTLTGSVTPWVQIPSTDETTSCNWSTWGSQANTAAANAGFNPSSYDYVQYALAPGATSCGWAGLAYLPGTQSWVRAEYDDLRVSGHELGHNFGTHHSNSYSCSENGTAVPLSTAANCSSSEYGDPFSIMGSANNYEHTNFSRGNFGWLAGSNTLDVSSSGSYSLDPIEPHDSGVQALRIKRDSSTYLLLEYRQPDGANFDNFSSGSAVATGVTVRVVNSYSTMTQSQLVDATPGDGTFGNAALALNHSLTDPVSNATVTPTALTASSATVQVTFGPDTTKPTAPTGLSANATDGTHVSLNWGASTDNIGVTGYRIYRGGVQVGTSTTTSYTDGGLTPNTSYSYTVTAVDAAQNESSPSNTASATTPIVDTSAPTAPGNLVASKSSKKPIKVALTWTGSSDNVGVAGYRVFRNNTQIAQVSSLSYVDTHPSKGSDTYTVTAYDAAGNVSNASNSATVNV
jgi:chitodextrinase